MAVHPMTIFIARHDFDDLLDDVIRNLDPRLQRLIEEVPIIVEDVPPREVIRNLARHRGLTDSRDLARLHWGLCGLYTGIPITNRHVEMSGRLPDNIHLFRDGIIRAALGPQFRLAPDHSTPQSLAQSPLDNRQIADALHNQIRITVMHEIGHHFGLNEADLRLFGYG